MKESVYLETTIISYLNGRPTSDLIIEALQTLTKEWWAKRREDFDLYDLKALFVRLNVVRPQMQTVGSKVCMEFHF